MSNKNHENLGRRDVNEHRNPVPSQVQKTWSQGQRDAYKHGQDDQKRKNS